MSRHRLEETTVGKDEQLALSNSQEQQQAKTKPEGRNKSSRVHLPCTVLVKEEVIQTNDNDRRTRPVESQRAPHIRIHI
jgi:hypothetical protein